MKQTEMRALILKISKRSYDEKLFAGTSGNLSIYDPDSKIIAITPSGIDYQTMKTEDISLITVDGDILEGPHKPSSEWRMHAAIYRDRADVRAVIHTHSPYATAFSVIREGIPAILEEMIPHIGGDVPVSEFAPAGTEALGTEALKALCRRRSCLLANHGVLAVGVDIDQAYKSAVYTEDAAKIYAIARNSGAIRVLPAETQNNIRRKYNMTEEL
ncbi:MAG: class II aldolase/adducin family protein [Clostridiales Family XIII bacterium]|jgi:ribulose-5-phosphate 4-epimerase/fuculose-1-phosphate aldolase|nr:class II aldolase/adducin family protein [Clostridiales Family XIII bacterium]